MKLLDRALNRLVPASKAAAGCSYTNTQYRCWGAALQRRAYDTCTGAWTAWVTVDAVGCK